MRPVTAAARPRHGERAVVTPYRIMRSFKERFVVRAQIDLQTPSAAILVDEIPIRIGDGFGL